MSLVSADDVTGEIVAKAKAGWKSFGETIGVSLESSGPTETAV